MGNRVQSGPYSGFHGGATLNKGDRSVGEIEFAADEPLSAGGPLLATRVNPTP
jgi:hypothetical protein